MIPNISGILFIIVCIVVFFIFVYFLYPKTRTDDEIFENIIVGTNAGDVRGATISKTPDGQYINLYPDGERKKEANPIRLDGTPITSFNQPGEISYTADGFKIKGIDTADFTCLDPFVWDQASKKCVIKPLCSSEEGSVKGIDQTYFNTLGIYTLKDIPLRAGTRATEPVYHKRVFAICGKDTDHTLHVCPQNKLFDSDSKTCKIYDYCNDRLDGETHTYPLSESSPALAETEYYQCQANKSVLKSCGVGEVYSQTHKMCITQNPCFGKGDATLPNGDNSYISCKNDSGVVVHCTDGVFVDGDRIECKNSACDNVEIRRYTQYNDYDFGYSVLSCKPGTNVVSEDVCDGAFPIPLPYTYPVIENTNFKFEKPSTENNQYYGTLNLVDSNAQCIKNLEFDIRPDKTESWYFSVIEGYPPVVGRVRAGVFTVEAEESMQNDTIFCGTYRGDVVSSTGEKLKGFMLPPKTYYSQDELYTKAKPIVEVGPNDYISWYPRVGDKDRLIYAVQRHTGYPGTSLTDSITHVITVGADGSYTIVFEYPGTTTTLEYDSRDDLMADVRPGMSVMIEDTVDGDQLALVPLHGTEPIKLVKPNPDVGGEYARLDVFNPIDGRYYNVYRAFMKSNPNTTIGDSLVASDFMEL